MNKPPAMVPDLPADYYLKNFQFMVDWVLERYADLLNDDEHQFIATFKGLSRASQCLLVRLSGRKGPLFRSDKLDYAEIESIEAAAQELIATGMLCSDMPLSIDEAACALTKAELIGLCGNDLPGAKGMRKESVVAELSELYRHAKTWQEWTSNELGVVYRLHNPSIVSNFLLLFFGNAYQDLTEFVLQDLGLYRYETYTLDHQHRVFKSRVELEQYQLLVQLRAQLDQADNITALTSIAEALPATTTSARLERRRARLCNQLAYALERAGEHSVALPLYVQSHLPPARERRIRLLEKQGDLPDAWALLTEILHTPCDEHELQIAQRMAPRLAKKMGQRTIKPASAPIVEHAIVMERTLDASGNPLRVEEAVRQHLDHAEAPCCYVENVLFTGLFGLWLWPEMFRGTDGAFANPFQAAPLDLYQENFAANRPGIAQLWELLDDGRYQEHIRQLWREKNGITNHLVHWQFLDATLLDLALQCIPASHLKMIFERLLFDIKNNRSGLPDLIQFYPTQIFPAENSYRMIEVKGPGDRIQDNQQRWLNYFSLKSIPAEVWYVNWQ